MGQALYRTHRPRKLSEIVGQEHTTTALAHALKKGTISHAYLFTGPRGTGKTSIARILAHEINELPYDDDSIHLDIIEIDAASNRRIEEIRDLRDKVHIAPTSAKYKVYIIDEVHMLTKEAFNALLKTLEEPPAHVIFILATTEAHKLPETIISRTQRFSFKPVELSKVAAYLREVAAAENIAITDEALQLVAEHGGGSFRDSMSLLDQVRNHDGEVSLADVQRMLGIAPQELIATLISTMAGHDALKVAESLQEVQDRGYEPAQIAKQLGSALRIELLSGKSLIPSHTILPLLSRLVAVPASPDPKTALEISLLDVALANTKPPVASSNPVSPAKTAVAPSPTITAPAPRPVSTKPKEPVVEQSITPKQPAQEKPRSGVTLDPTIWPEVLANIKGHHNTLYGIIRNTQPHFGAGEVTLACDTAFAKRQVEQTKNRDIIAGAIEQLTSETVFIHATIGTEANSAPSSPSENTNTEAAASDANPFASVSNIFGGGELLES